MNTTPGSLLERLRQPAEQRDWDRFAHLYTPFLYFLALRLGLKGDDAADLVQDVFLLLVQKLPAFSYDHHQSFRAWLRAVVTNRWRDRCRRLSGAPVVEAPGGVLPEVPDADPADLFTEQEYRHHVSIRALELMQRDFQPNTWKACWEHVVRGRPAAEVAAELGITVNAVYVATSRVLARLREELAGLLD